MKIKTNIYGFVLTTLFAVLLVTFYACSSGPKAKVVELENKGTGMSVSTPDWIRVYTAHGITRLQSQSEFRDRYCVVGEETGINRQFVVAWADNFSAQQRIGAMLRTTISSNYQAKVQAASRTSGLGSPTQGTSTYQQEIDNILNSVINVSYSGAQRESDWWTLRRRYDPDQKDVYTDSYTAYVLYTIPRSQLNQQVAHALETSVSRDSALYDITIEMARQILREGIPNWGEGE
ncbi:MAG: hypothetical protein FWD47_05665 [Treponema sp.]|nr:hypothetical protein [Treponema sp.]